MVEKEKNPNRTISLQIGDVSCALMCQDAETAQQLRQLYAGFLTDQDADINIGLGTVERFDTQYTPSVPAKTKALRWGNQIAALCYSNGAVPGVPGPFFHVTVEAHQLTAQYQFKVMNTVLPAAYYTAQRRRHPDTLPGMIVHSCGIIRNDHLLLFTGPSETGKTTIARLCGAEHGRVLNDEMVLLAGAGKGIKGYGIPIFGGVPPRSNGTAFPACVMVLKQAASTSVRPLARIDAYLRFVRQIIAPRDLTKPDDTKAMLGEISHFADAFTKSVPFFELEFNLDEKALWKTVEDIEATL